MAFDGTVWNEAIPTDSDVANEIDDYMRDLKAGIRSRMAHEHAWVSSMAATNIGGGHTFITFQAQTGAPSLAASQQGSLYVSSTASGHQLIYLNSAATPTILVNSAGRMNVPTRAFVWYVADVLATGTKLSAVFAAPCSGTFTGVYGYLRSTATGASVIVDVNKEGASIIAGKLTIAAAATTGEQTTISTAAFAAGNLVSMDIDQIGSATAGSDLTITAVFTPLP